LFSSLSDEELAGISSKITPKIFKKNETILHEEDTNEYMYFILAGGVKVAQINEDGKETILALHKGGDFFGEMSLIDGKTVPAAVIATENATVAVISKQDFHSLIFTNPKLLMKLLQIFCSRFRESYERIQLLSFNNASQRIKTLFLMLSHNYGKKKPEGMELELKLTHQNIADMSGITRETVTRIINKWQKEGDIFLTSEKHIRLNPGFAEKEFTI
jgi:CRP/FNR family transcriptional regulator